MSNTRFSTEEYWDEWERFERRLDEHFEEDPAGEFARSVLEILPTTSSDPLLRTRLEEKARLSWKLRLETDRGCALAAAPYLDNLLGECFTRHFGHAGKLVSKLLDHRGAVGTFSSRIDWIFALGLVPTIAHRELDLIRRIRNDFAHSSDPDLRFEGSPISDRCRELSFWTTKKPRPRERFLRSFGALYMLIAGVTDKTPAVEPFPDADWSARVAAAIESMPTHRPATAQERDSDEAG
jgi:hypothetical protein